METDFLTRGENKKYRCSNCNKVLFYGVLIEGFISKDCPRCGERNHFHVTKEVVVSEKFECVKKEHPLN